MGFWSGDDKTIVAISGTKMLSDTDYYNNAIIQSVLAKIKGNSDLKTYLANLSSYGTASFKALKSKGNNAYITHNVAADSYYTDTSGYNFRTTCTLLGRMNDSALKTELAEDLDINVESISTFLTTPITTDNATEYEDYIGEYYIKSKYSDYNYSTMKFHIDGEEYIYKYTYHQDSTVVKSSTTTKDISTDEFVTTYTYYQEYHIVIAKTSTNINENHLIPQNSYSNCVLVTYTINNIADSRVMSNTGTQKNSTTIESYPLIPVRMYFFTIDQYDETTAAAANEDGFVTRPYYITEDRYNESEYVLKSIGFDIENIIESIDDSTTENFRAAKIMLGFKVYNDLPMSLWGSGAGYDYDEDYCKYFAYLTDDELAEYKYMDKESFCKGRGTFESLNLTTPDDYYERRIAYQAETGEAYSPTLYIKEELDKRLEKNTYYKTICKYLYLYFSSLITDNNIVTGYEAEDPDDFIGLTIQVTEFFSTHVTAVTTENIRIISTEEGDNTLTEPKYSYKWTSRTITYTRQEMVNETGNIVTNEYTKTLKTLSLTCITSTQTINILLEGFSSGSCDAADATNWQQDESLDNWIPLIPSTVDRLSYLEQIALMRESLYMITTSQQFEEGDFFEGAFFEIIKVVITIVLICIAPYAAPGFKMLTAAGSIGITSLTTAGYFATALTYAVFSAIAMQALNTAFEGNGLLSGIASIVIAAISIYASGGLNWDEPLNKIFSAIKLVQIPINAINAYTQGIVVEQQESSNDMLKNQKELYNTVLETAEDSFYDDKVSTQLLSYLNITSTDQKSYIISTSRWYDYATRIQSTDQLYQEYSLMNNYYRLSTESRIGV